MKYLLRGGNNSLQCVSLSMRTLSKNVAMAIRVFVKRSRAYCRQNARYVIIDEAAEAGQT